MGRSHRAAPPISTLHQQHWSLMRGCSYNNSWQQQPWLLFLQGHISHLSMTMKRHKAAQLHKGKLTCCKRARQEIKGTKVYNKINIYIYIYNKKKQKSTTNTANHFRRKKNVNTSCQKCDKRRQSYEEKTTTSEPQTCWKREKLLLEDIKLLKQVTKND